MVMIPLLLFIRVVASQIVRWRRRVLIKCRGSHLLSLELRGRFMVVGGGWDEYL